MCISSSLNQSIDDWSISDFKLTDTYSPIYSAQFHYQLLVLVHFCWSFHCIVFIWQCLMSHFKITLSNFASSTSPSLLTTPPILVHNQQQRLFLSHFTSPCPHTVSPSTVTSRLHIPYHSSENHIHVPTGSLEDLQTLTLSGPLTLSDHWPTHITSNFPSHED